MTKKGQWNGAFAAYGEAFEQIKRNPQPAVLYVGLSAVLTIISLVAQGQVFPRDPGHISYEDITVLIFWLALPVYGLAIGSRRNITIAEFMRFELKKYLSLIAVILLTVLIVAGSLLLLIVPAIWTIAWFSFVTYAVVDKNLGPIAALKESKRLAKAHISKVWGMIGVSILFGIAASIFMVVPYIGNIASAFVGLLTYGALAVLYRWLQHNNA